jgi:hypothetical protein
MTTGKDLLGAIAAAAAASRAFSSRAIRANVFAMFVSTDGVYRKALDRHERCPFGRRFAIVSPPWPSLGEPALPGG